MANSIYDLSTTASSNTTIDGTDVSGTTGKVKDGDNVMRSLGAYMAQWVDDQGGVATTSGSANTQTVTLASGFSAYATGQTFTVKLGYTNTSTTVTLNVNSIGAKSVKVNFGGILADPIPGDLRAGAYARFLYDGTYMVLLDAQQQGRYAPGTLYGLTLSNNASDATNDIDIAVGSARSSDDSANMDLLSALTKQLDAGWASGSAQGGRFYNPLVNGTQHVYLIKNPSTGAIDAGFSDNATNPTGGAFYPAAYTLYRRIGSILRESGANVAFTQNGDEFLRSTPVADVSATNPGTSAVTRTLSVPTGVVVTAILTLAINNNGGSTAIQALLTSLAASNVAASLANSQASTVASTVSYGVGTAFVRTNTSAQIRSRVSFSDANTNLIVSTDGWIDTRGRLN